MFAYLQSELQRDFEKRDVRQAVHQSGNLKRILCQFEDVRGGVNVFLDGLQDRLQPTTVTWKGFDHSTALEQHHTTCICVGAHMSANTNTNIEEYSSTFGSSEHGRGQLALLRLYVAQSEPARIAVGHHGHDVVGSRQVAR